MRINLIPPEDRAGQRLVPGGRLLVVAGVFVLALAVVAASLNQQRLAEARRRVESLRQEVAELESQQQELARTKEAIERIEEGLRTGQAAASQRATVRPLSDVTRRVADAARRARTVWLTRLSWTQGRLQIDGLALEEAGVTAFLTILTADGGLSQTRGGTKSAAQAGWLVEFASELAIRTLPEATGKASGTGVGGDGAHTPVAR